EPFIELINLPAESPAAAADWEGDIAFLVQAEPDIRVPDDVWGYLDLWNGAARGGGGVDMVAGKRAAYVLSTPYTRWKDILLGELVPIKGMMQGKLKVRGDL